MDKIYEIIDIINEFIGDIFGIIFTLILGFFEAVLSSFSALIINIFSEVYDGIVLCGKSFFTMIFDILPMGFNGIQFGNEFIFFFVGVILSLFLLKIIINAVVSFISNLL